MRAKLSNTSRSIERIIERLTGPRRPVVSVVSVGSVFAVVGLAACGDDDPGADSAACDAFVAVDQAFNIDEDPEAGLAALRDFASEAPDDVAEPVERLIASMEADMEAAFESEELATAETAADEYAADHCGDTTLEVEAVNFAFVGIPDEIDAGRVVFDMTNHTQTDEFHEALVLRKADALDGSAHDLLVAGFGPTMSVADLDALEDSFELYGFGWLEPSDISDGRDVFVVDLDPGEYIVACLLPVDSAELLDVYASGGEVEAPRHVNQGMFAEITVT